MEMNQGIHHYALPRGLGGIDFYSYLNICTSVLPAFEIYKQGQGSLKEGQVLFKTLCRFEAYDYHFHILQTFLGVIAL
jgi:hypothetical protein